MLETAQRLRRKLDIFVPSQSNALSSFKRKYFEPDTEKVELSPLLIEKLKSFFPKVGENEGNVDHSTGHRRSAKRTPSL